MMTAPKPVAGKNRQLRIRMADIRFKFTPGQTFTHSCYRVKKVKAPDLRMGQHSLPPGENPWPHIPLDRAEWGQWQYGSLNGRRGKFFILPTPQRWRGEFPRLIRRDDLPEPDFWPAARFTASTGGVRALWP